MSGLLARRCCPVCRLASTASASEIVLDLDADAAALRTALASAHAAAPREWQIVLPAASGKRAPLLLRTYEPFAKEARVYLDEQALGPDDYDVTDGLCPGNNLWCSQFLCFSGAESQWRCRPALHQGWRQRPARLIKTGRRNTEERAARELGPNTVNPFLNDVADPPNQGFVMPQSAYNPRARVSAPINTQSVPKPCQEARAGARFTPLTYLPGRLSPEF